MQQVSGQTAEKPRFEITTSRQFTAWMAEQRVSLAFTTYQAGKVFLLGLKPDGGLEIFNRTCERCMGLCLTDQTFWLSSLFQLWRFENALEPGQQYQGYDRLYVPQMAYTTGDLDIHDVAVDKAGRPVFVNTLFGCLATVSETHSFKPLWQPPFISKLAAEDRCHLNGLAMQDGEPRYVTAVSQSDVADGWRDHRQDVGVVIDVTSNEVILDGLSMPHSPRVHQGKLWLLDSGNGNLGYLDRSLRRGARARQGSPRVGALPPPKMHHLVGRALVALQRPEEGLEAFEATVRLDPEDRALLQEIAEFRQSLGPR